MKKRKIYRFEQANGNGCWYNSNNQFNNFYGRMVENIQMPYDNRPKTHRAGCFSLKTLYQWGNKKALQKMHAVVIVVLSDDYILLPKGEVIYNEHKTYYKKVLKRY